MFGILLSAFNSILGFILRSVIVKFFIFFALFFVTSEFIPLITGLLPSSASLNGSLSAIPSGVWFFLDLFNISAGIPLLLSAYATRFIIRRIPIIG
jgi:hypothetical protein